MLQTFQAPTSADNTSAFLEVLKNVDKAKKLLETLKKKEDSITKKLTKYNKITSAEAYCKKQQAEATAAMEELAEERKKAAEAAKEEQQELLKIKNQINKQKLALSTLGKELDQKTEEVNASIKALDEYNKELKEKEAELEKRESYAESLVIEYNGKLADIKERLKGL